MSAPDRQRLRPRPVHARRGPPLRVVPEKDLEKQELFHGSPYPKCSLFLRGCARVFDIAVAYGLFALLGNVGMPAALIFLLLADGMLQGQSLGKRLFGVRVMHLPTRSPARHRDSTLRNAPIALIVLLGMMPESLGPVAFLAGTLVIGGVELFAVLRDPLGQRRGDLWAETQVVDAKEVSGVPVAGRRTAIAPAHGRAHLEAARRRTPSWHQS